MQPQILLVEDCPEERALIVDWLGEAGHQVDTAEHDKEALAKLRANRPLILIIASPFNGSDGREVLRRARAGAGWCDPAVILLTSERERLLFRRSPEAIDVHLPKPINPAELVRFVERILVGFATAE